MLRHIYLTDIYKGEKYISERQAIAKQFQHTASMSQQYIKK